MAKRRCFIATPNENKAFKEIEVEFKYFSGFSLSQKQKSISALHESIKQVDSSLDVLEVSTKSPDPTGFALSAFNLKLLNNSSGNEIALENIFQSSKVFENGGPYRDLLNVHPREAKKDERLISSGSLKCFNYDNTIWELEPKTMFYDWIYINAVYRNIKLSKNILQFNAFTDIEFNQAKSINCQARSAAIFVSLSKNGTLSEMLNDKERFKRIYSEIRQQGTLLFE